MKSGRTGCRWLPRRMDRCRLGCPVDRGECEDQEDGRHGGRVHALWDWRGNTRMSRRRRCRGLQRCVRLPSSLDSRRIGMSHSRHRNPWRRGSAKVVPRESSICTHFVSYDDRIHETRCRSDVWICTHRRRLRRRGRSLLGWQGKGRPGQS